MRRLALATLLALVPAAALAHEDDEKHDKMEHAAPVPDEAWTCPMHPKVVQDHPGECPKCGMKLEKAEALYVCPHHPDATRSKPGKCAVCGMDLQRVEVGHHGDEGEKHEHHE